MFQTQKGYKYGFSAYEAKSDGGEKLYLRGAGGPLPLAVHQSHQQAKSSSSVSTFQVRPSHHAHVSTYIYHRVIQREGWSILSMLIHN